MVSKIYAGIGSRETPKEVLKQCEYIARRLSDHGYTLSSGGAIGADTAFEDGSTSSIIFTPESEIKQWAFDSVDKYHPVPHRLSEHARRLHARNAMILFGQDKEFVVDFIICWTKEGGVNGGTGQALRIANDMGLEVYNLYYLDADQILNMIL